MTAAVTKRPSLDDIRAEGALTTVKFAGEVLGISADTAGRWARQGDIPTVKIGGTVRVPTEWLLGIVAAA